MNPPDQLGDDSEQSEPGSNECDGHAGSLWGWQGKDSLPDHRGLYCEHSECDGDRSKGDTDASPMDRQAARGEADGDDADHEEDYRSDDDRPARSVRLRYLVEVHVDSCGRTEELTSRDGVIPRQQRSHHGEASGNDAKTARKPHRQSRLRRLRRARRAHPLNYIGIRYSVATSTSVGGLRRHPGHPQPGRTWSVRWYAAPMHPGRSTRNPRPECPRLRTRHGPESPVRVRATEVGCWFLAMPTLSFPQRRPGADPLRSSMNQPRAQASDLHRSRRPRGSPESRCRHVRRRTRACWHTSFRSCRRRLR